TQIFRQLGKFFVWLGTLLKRFGAYLKEIYTVLMSASEEELPPREKKITGGEKSSPALAGPATNFSGDDRREEEQVKAQNAPEPFYQKERRLALVEPPDNDEPPSPYQKRFRLPSFYTPPSLDLLARPSRLGEQQQNKGIRERARLLESTLESF